MKRPYTQNPGRIRRSVAMAFADAPSIVRLWSVELVSTRALGRRYGVSNQTIQEIIEQNLPEQARRDVIRRINARKRPPAKAFVPIGSIRVRKHDGQSIRWIKIGEARWIKYARYLWIREHGTIPRGHGVMHKDGNSLNDEHSNLMCVSTGIVHFVRSNPVQEARRLSRLRKAKAEIRRAAAVAKTILLPPPPTAQVVTCESCGADYEGTPSRCVKCGSSSFSRVPVALPRGRAA